MRTSSLWFLVLAPFIFNVSASAAPSVSTSSQPSSQTTALVSSVASTDIQNAKKKKKAQELDFMGTYFPFEMDDYAPAVDDTGVKAGTWVGSILCFPLVGWGVGEMLMLGDDAPETSDAMMIALVHTGLVLGGVVMTMTGIGAIIGIPLILAVEFWFAPVAMLNAWNRGLRAGGRKKASLPGSRRSLAFNEDIMAF